jgi:hypothetical protein
VALLCERLERLLEDKQYIDNMQNTLSMDFGNATGDSLSPLHFTPYALYTIQKEEHKKTTKRK